MTRRTVMPLKTKMPVITPKGSPGAKAQAKVAVRAMPLTRMILKTTIKRRPHPRQPSANYCYKAQEAT